jgi:hypothetical protein
MLSIYAEFENKTVIASNVSKPLEFFWQMRFVCALGLKLNYLYNSYF